MNTIGERFKHLRKLHNLNQVECAKLIGISQGTLSDIEKNKSNPSVDTIISSSRYFQISTDWLLTGKDEISDELHSQLDSIEIKGVKSLNESEIQCLDLFQKLEPLQQGIILGRMIELVNNNQKSRNKRGQSSNYHNGEETATKEMA